MNNNFIKELKECLSNKVIGSVEIYYEDFIHEYTIKICRRDFNYYYRLSIYEKFYDRKHINIYVGKIIENYKYFILEQYFDKGAL